MQRIACKTKLADRDVCRAPGALQTVLRVRPHAPSTVAFQHFVCTCMWKALKLAQSQDATVESIAAWLQFLSWECRGGVSVIGQSNKLESVVVPLVRFMCSHGETVMQCHVVMHFRSRDMLVSETGV